jgi:chitosanase
MLSTLLALAFLSTTTTAYAIPSNLATIYTNHKSRSCSNKLGDTGFNNGFPSVGSNFGYCGDLSNAIFLHSSGDGGRYANMDIDCDGANLGSGDCGNDPSGQGMTAFMDTVAGYGKGIEDLDANVHSYVVFGNFESSPEFDPESFGMKPLSVMAIVCNNQLVSFVFPDSATL